MFVLSIAAGLLAAATPPAGIGIETVDVPAAYASRFGVRGAYVVRVTPGSPAESAGIVPGDVVEAVGGRAIADEAGLRAQTAAFVAQTSVSLNVGRYGRTLTVAVTPVDDRTLYPSLPSCEPSDVATALDEAATSQRRREYDNMSAHAARALDLAEVCASLQARAEERTMLRVADAFTALGAAAADRGEETAKVYLANAYSVASVAAHMPGSTGAERNTAAAMAAALAKQVPFIGAQADSAATLGLGYAGAGLGKSPFVVESSWVTQGDNFGKVLHLRVKIDLPRDALLYASGFCVKVSSDVGAETFSALDTSAADTVRGHTPIDRAKDDVAPEEDFGRLGHVFFARGVPQTYVLTFEIVDRFADVTSAPASLAYAPQ
jgi:hypothetical protein